MDDIDILRQAQLLLGQYGFEAEQDGVAKAIRIISATARRLGVANAPRVRLSVVVSRANQPPSALSI